MSVSIKRVYESPGPTDGKRVLVDRLWPRGITKAQAKIDLWLKDIAPSNELRKWFSHDPEKWPDFQRKYRDELKGSPALADLKEWAHNGKVTLVFAAKDESRNNAVVLRDLISQGD